MSMPVTPRHHRDSPVPRTSTPLAALGAPPSDAPYCPDEDHHSPEGGTDPRSASPPRTQDGEEEGEEETSAEEDASIASSTPPRSDASELEDSGDFPPDPPSAAHCSGDSSPLSPALSSWHDIVSAITLKFVGDMLPPSPRKRTCRVPSLRLSP